MNRNWPPEFSYDGPYPRHLLSRARRILVSALSETNIKALEKVKPKIGLDSKYGIAVVPTDLPGYPLAKYGYAASSHYFNKDYNGTPFKNPTTWADDDESLSKNNSFSPQKSGGSSTAFSTFMKSATASSSNISQNLSMREHSKSPVSILSSIGSAPGTSKDITLESPSKEDFYAYKDLQKVVNNIQPCINIKDTKPSSPKTSESLFHYNDDNDYKDGTAPIIEKREELNIPVYYSGIFNKSSTPKPATVSRPPSRNSNTSSFLEYNLEDDKDDRKTTSKRNISHSNIVPLKRCLSNEFKAYEENDHVNKKSRLSSMHQGSQRVDSTSNMFQNQPTRKSPFKITVYKRQFNITKISDADFKNSYLVYKCDFCKSTSYTPQILDNHLKTSQHFSGSLYKARDIDSGIELISVVKMLALKNKYSKLHCLVVSCPECKELFEDIFMCGLHSKYMHNVVTGFYCISPVINHQTVVVSTRPHCVMCGNQYKTHRDLHNHWEEKISHHPYPSSSIQRDTQTFSVTICPYCQKTFRNSFLLAKMHVIYYHDQVHKGSLALQVKEIFEPKNREELPPFDASNSSNGLQSELEILENMENHFRSMAESKSKVMKIQNRMAELRSILKIR